MYNELETKSKNFLFNMNYHIEKKRKIRLIVTTTKNIPTITMNTIKIFISIKQ